jgi:hypothetical protein
MDDRGAKAAFLPIDQANKGIRPPTAMADPAAVEKIFALDDKTGGILMSFGEGIDDHMAAVAGYAFVGVQQENPIMFASIHSELLLGAKPRKGVMEYLAAQRFRDFHGSVLTTGVDHYDLIGERDAPNTVSNVLFFVSSNDRNR